MENFDIKSIFNASIRNRRPTRFGVPKKENENSLTLFTEAQCLRRNKQLAHRQKHDFEEEASYSPISPSVFFLVFLWMSPLLVVCLCDPLYQFFVCTEIADGTANVHNRRNSFFLLSFSLSAQYRLGVSVGRSSCWRISMILSTRRESLENFHHETVAIIALIHQRLKSSWGQPLNCLTWLNDVCSSWGIVHPLRHRQMGFS